MSIQFNRIILVDDELAHVTLVERNFRRMGYEKEIIKLQNGQQLLDMINGKEKNQTNDNFPLIVLDINMPIKSGVEVLGELKTNVETSYIPIIVLTTSDDPTEIEQCYKLGCNAYLTKPVMAEEFKDKITSLSEFLNIVSTPVQAFN